MIPLCGGEGGGTEALSSHSQRAESEHSALNPFLSLDPFLDTLLPPGSQEGRKAKMAYLSRLSISDSSVPTSVCAQPHPRLPLPAPPSPPPTSPRSLASFRAFPFPPHPDSCLRAFVASAPFARNIFSPLDPGVPAHPLACS